MTSGHRQASVVKYTWCSISKELCILFTWLCFIAVYHQLPSSFPFWVFLIGIGAITCQWSNPEECKLTHWGRVTHICFGKLTIIGSDNGLSPERRQAIIWTNAGILLIGPLETNFSEIFFAIKTFSLKKIRFNMSSAKCCSFRLGPNVLTNHIN